MVAARVAAHGLSVGAGGLCGVLAVCVGLSGARCVQGAGAVSVCTYMYVQM